MRADRLLSLVLLLQARERMTAAEIADALEISVATARRDLEALSSAGVPVYAQPGRHGGWQLLGDARTDLTGFTTGDARALFWLLGTAGFEGPGVRGATQKLLQALPAPLREEAETLATSIHYDHAEWGRSHGGTTAELDLLRTALLQHRALRVRYTNRSRDTYTTVLRPLGLVAKAGEWYLVAESWQGTRTYRVSRLGEVELTEDGPEAPADFDLVEHWRAHTRQIEQGRSGVAATLCVPQRLAPLLLQQFGTYASVLEPGLPGPSDDELAARHEGAGDLRAGDDVTSEAGSAGRRESDGEEGWCLLEVRAHLLVALAEQLAGWGGRIRVLAPAALRAELVRVGEELIAQHRS